MTASVWDDRTCPDSPGPAGRIGGTLLLVGLSAALAALPTLAAGLQYERDALIAGELWRLLTGHLAHYSWSHLAWNVLAFGVLGALCERHDRRRFVLAILVSAVAIPIGLLLGAPVLVHYRGLSGVTSALFGLLALRVIVEQAQDGRTLAAFATGACCLGFILTLARTWVAQETLLTTGFGVDVMPVPVAHAIGLGIGAALAIQPKEIR